MQQSVQKGGQVGPADACPQLDLRSCDGDHGLAHFPAQLGQVVGSAVGEAGLGLRPDPFIGVEFGGVGREAFQAQPGVFPAQVPYRLPPMATDVVPHHDDRAPEVAKEVSKEPADLRLLDVLGMDLEVEAEAMAARTHGDSRDDREPIVSGPVTQDRSPSARSPGASDAGDQEEPALVSEDEMGAQPRGVFFIRGHSFSFHSRMLPSSRCNARRVGFWGVQPS